MHYQPLLRYDFTPEDSLLLLESSPDQYWVHNPITVLTHLHLVLWQWFSGCLRTSGELRKRLLGPLQEILIQQSLIPGSLCVLQQGFKKKYLFGYAGS